MKRETELLALLLERIAEIEDLVHQAHNVGINDIRLTRLGILLAGMLHMFENGRERDISEAVAELVLRQIDSSQEKAAGNAVADLVNGFGGINLN